MKTAVLSSTPHAASIDADLFAHGVSPEKWWIANEKSNGAMLRDYLACHKREVSNRRFNPAVHQTVVLRKLDAYHKKLRKDMPEVLL